MRPSLSLLVVVLCASEARASQCASPTSFVLPRKSVEEGGLLFVFIPTNYRRYPEEDQQKLARSNEEMLREFWIEASDGKALPFGLKLLARGGVFDVFSLRVKAKVGTEFVVRPVQSSFAITVVKRKKQSPVTLEVQRAADENFADSLSDESVRTLIPSLEAPAFRVTWNAGSIVMPGRIMYGDYAQRGVRLGRLFCTGTSAWWKTPTEFTVTALMSDGREVTAEPVMLEPPPPYESLPFRKFP